MNMRRSKAAIGLLLTTAMVGGSITGALAQDEDSQRVAFFAASSQNGFNAAVWDGVAAAAENLGIEAEVFDGEFSAEVQLAQVEDAVASGRFDGFVIVANDTVGIGSAISDAYASGIPTVTALFPIGSDLTTLEPQVDGIVGTVASPPAEGAALEAEAVVEFCADKDPCNVVILIGFKSAPFDLVRFNEFNRVLDEHDNIVVVADQEGWYDRDQSLTVMQDILQANPQIDAILSNADQHLSGAEIAVIEQGLAIEDLFLIGAGATQDAVDAVRQGRWDATYANFPRSMGEESLKILAAEMNGEEHPTVVDMDELALIGPILTTEILQENPDFEAEWQG